MMFDYTPSGVCAKEITFEIEDGRLHSVNFAGGCKGNLAAISRLIEGADAVKVADILRGNTCGHRPTSCADQLACAIDEAVARESRKAS
ncbi:MAG: TIGR03905 family TSCPD domain-containing protein [Synergistaceae bacterium]|nr:TIGR03905 family TSCPD domain-containing protein [Synergistaceae bacterium]